LSQFLTLAIWGGILTLVGGLDALGTNDVLSQLRLVLGDRFPSGAKSFPLESKPDELS
jgi:hypothetical protein